MWTRFVADKLFLSHDHGSLVASLSLQMDMISKGAIPAFLSLLPPMAGPGAKIQGKTTRWEGLDGLGALADDSTQAQVKAFLECNFSTDLAGPGYMFI